MEAFEALEIVVKLVGMMATVLLVMFAILMLWPVGPPKAPDRDGFWWGHKMTRREEALPPPWISAVQAHRNIQNGLDQISDKLAAEGLRRQEGREAARQDRVDARRSEDDRRVAAWDEVYRLEAERKRIAAPDGPTGEVKTPPVGDQMDLWAYLGYRQWPVDPRCLPEASSSTVEVKTDELPAYDRVQITHNFI